jgi:hypothetical protein
MHNDRANIRKHFQMIAEIIAKIFRSFQQCFREIACAIECAGISASFATAGKMQHFFVATTGPQPKKSLCPILKTTVSNRERR